MLLIFTRVVKLYVQAQALYLLILNIKSCWHNAEFAIQLLGESDTNQNRNTIYQINTVYGDSVFGCLIIYSS